MEGPRVSFFLPAGLAFCLLVELVVLSGIGRANERRLSAMKPLQLPLQPAEADELANEAHLPLGFGR